MHHKSCTYTRILCKINYLMSSSHLSFAYTYPHCILMLYVQQINMKSFVKCFASYSVVSKDKCQLSKELDCACLSVYVHVGVCVVRSLSQSGNKHFFSCAKAAGGLFYVLLC